MIIVFFVVYHPVPNQLANPIMAYLSMFGKESACLKISANATSSGCSLIIFPSFPPSPHPHLSPSFPSFPIGAARRIGPRCFTTRAPWTSTIPR